MNNKRHIAAELLKRISATVVLLSVLMSGIITSSADKATAEADIAEASQTARLEDNYRKKAKEYTLSYYSGEDIVFNAADIHKNGGSAVGAVNGYDGGSVYIKQGETAEFSFLLPSDNLYWIKLYYFDACETTLTTACEIKIDGEYPFYEMRSQSFESEWYYESTDFETDRYGNEIVPESKRESAWREKYLNDSTALTMEPLGFELLKGGHTLSVTCTQGGLYIGTVAFTGKSEDEKIKIGKPQGDETVVIEGERFSSKNDATVRPTGEYDAAVYPYSYSSLKLNMLSGSSFSSGGQRVTYSFNVDKSGYYYIGFKYRQNTKTDFPVFRYLYIDGALCNDSFKNAAFDYSKDFTSVTVTDGSGEPIGVWLEADVKHTLTLAVSLENIADIVDDVNAVIDEINAMSLKIMKVTGNNTSKYRDFDIVEYIPEIKDTLTDWADRIDSIYEKLHAFSPNVKTVGEFSKLKICVKQLRSLADNIADLPNRISELYQGDSSVGQYLANTLESLYISPLTIDQIYIYQNPDKLPKQKGFFYKMLMSCMRFFHSFTETYTAKQSGDTDKHLEVWVNRSRLYVDLMQKMANDSFYERYGATVDISLMPNEEKLVLASASGSAPDAALGVTYTIPFELAVRGAVKKLSDYPDWDEVASRFGKGIIKIGAVDGDYYLLPETTDFLVLFYRKDILDELNLSVPDTMDDVKEMLPVLKRYGMDFYSHIAGHPGTKTLSVLVPFIYQMNGRVYGDNARDIRITSEQTVNAFSEMSDLFTIYDIPYEISNFYQHFRSGSLPIGISGFNTYMTLLNSAPEIANSWGIAPYPGYKDENGNVLRYISGAHSTAVIFESTKEPDLSWEFLKWWTSAEIQSDFAEVLRLTYGNEYMWNTANLEAFANLPWNSKHKETILEMLDWIVEVPRVPGNYMTQRSLSNSLNNIVLNNDNVRQSLYEAEKDIRAEIDSKLEEFGYMDGKKVIKDFKVVQ